MTPVQAVIWDFGSVLVRMVDETPRQELAKKLGIRLETLYRLVFESESSRLCSIGALTIDQHWQAIGRILRVPDAEMPALIAQFWSSDALDLELVDFIRSLRPRYKIGLLSNAFDDLRDRLENRWQIADLFDDLVISAEVKMIKPDLRIYRLAAERLGIAPQDAVFFDDMPENVHGARRAGMQAFQYTGLAEARRALASLEGHAGWP